MSVLVRSLGYQTIDLVWHDYGGSTAYVLASEHPEMVQRLVVIECAPAGLGETCPIAFLQFMNNSLGRKLSGCIVMSIYL